ncbi:MAG TPA: alginate lyase family protein [Blastocatellia bacterium]|nr:alginate lyase family protein [Blastocatellia bacterium]
MIIEIAQLKKIKGRSLRELRVRGKQEVTKLGERVLGWSTSEMSDSDFYNEIRPGRRNGSGAGTARDVLGRIRESVSPQTRAGTLIPALAHREQIVALMNARFAGQRDALIERADRAARGEFDLLGFKDLSFGNPIDWHLEPVSGKRSPLNHWSTIEYLNPARSGDKKVTWELNRHQHFVTLGQAYWLTNDERYAESFVAQATSWMDDNPPEQGINWTSSLEVAFRSISWLWALHLFAGSPYVTADFAARMLKFLIAHGRHINAYLSHYFSPNTHLTGEALGLFYLGSALPEFSRAKGWRETGLRILLEQLPVQVRADGVYFEQATYYHRYTADFYLHLLVLSRASDTALPAEVGRRLSLMLDHLMWITRPDRTSPVIGDDDGGRLILLGVRDSSDFSDTLAAGAAVFERGDWKFVAGEAACETLWLLGPEAVERYDRIAPEPPSDHERAFTEGGYYVMRDGWSRDSSYALIDCGPHGSAGCGHAHADSLSFEFASRGTTWLIDPGTFTYTLNLDMRNEFRVTSAHNTTMVDGESQSIPAGPFSWSHVARSSARAFTTGPSFAYFEGSHDGYERLEDRVTHSRGVMMVKAGDEHPLPTYLVLRDRFSARDSHRYEMTYHFPSYCSTVAIENRLKVAEPRGGRLLLTAFGTAPTKAEIRRGWVSRCHRHREQAPVGVIEATGRGSQEFVTFIIPGQASVSRAANGFAITAGRARDFIMTGDGAAQECGPVRARAELAWARLDAGETADGFTGAGFVFGDALEVCGVGFASEAIAESFSMRKEKAQDELSLSVSGVSRFRLSFDRPPARIRIGRTAFSLKPGLSSAVFVMEGAGWKVVDSINRVTN